MEWVAAFLERLPPDVVVQRLTGDPDPSALVAPMWTLKKQQTFSLIQKTLEAKDAWQGKLYRSLDKVPGGSYFDSNFKLNTDKYIKSNKIK